MVNPNLEAYKVLSSKDMFEAVAIVSEIANAGNNTSAAGIGEPPIVPTAGRHRQRRLQRDGGARALAAAHAGPRAGRAGGGEEGLMKSFELARPSSVAQARELLAERPGAVLKAGGIDLLDHLKEHLVEPPRSST